MMSERTSDSANFLGRRVSWSLLRRAAGLALLGLTLSLLAGCGAETVKDELPVYCLDKPSKTACSGGKRRYFYDYRKNSCGAFNYCGGKKLFETRESCEKECVGR